MKYIVAGGLSKKDALTPSWKINSIPRNFLTPSNNWTDREVNSIGMRSREELKCQARGKIRRKNSLKDCRLNNDMRGIKIPMTLVGLRHKVSISPFIIKY
jgi:hypothetical protein